MARLPRNGERGYFPDHDAERREAFKRTTPGERAAEAIALRRFLTKLASTSSVMAATLSRVKIEVSRSSSPSASSARPSSSALHTRPERQTGKRDRPFAVLIEQLPGHARLVEVAPR
jgi:hypothetical protein